MLTRHCELIAPPGRPQRKLLNLQSTLIFGDGLTVGAAVLDLSYDGCKIATSLALLPGVTLTITIAALPPMKAEVRWCSAGYSGLLFGAPAESMKQIRSQERSSINARALLRRAGKLNFEVNMFDLTNKGCKIEFVERPRVGEQLWIKFHWFQSIEATVRWLNDFHGGLEFANSIHPAVFDILVSKLRTTEV